MIPAPSSMFDVVPDDAHRKPRVLVVDDDLLVRKFLLETLQRRNFEVDTLPSGVQLSEVLEGSPPDLIILDVMMPWKNGLELCKSIKAHERWKSIPVLFLTGKRTDEDFAAGIRAGCDGYLTKPFTVKGLVQKISELLHQ